ncbi:MAG: 2-C-methyl-D-erythritol 4-phosphate cytidylyltransferase [Desulfovibrio sp.]|nr:2-C-methyl-D-erythritol 4-phosphate cytidylyltransferase [Desulfovibrio sp.]
MQNIWAIIVAAGKGSRLAQVTDTAKQFLLWKNAPLYWHSVRTFAQSPYLQGIILVLPATCLEEEKTKIARRLQREALTIPLLSCAGGEERSDSVRCGLNLLPPKVSHVLIHDAARPFASAALLANVCQALIHGAQAVIPGLPVSDTIKEIENGCVLKTLRRDRLVQVQTPQGFTRDLICQAHNQGKDLAVTDDASLVEALGVPVLTVAGEETNVKITRPSDLTLLNEDNGPKGYRLGQGYDVHRYGGSRPLILGGVPIATDLTVEAHSDGDVLLHAIMDALLGCAALGDIGDHFPDSDPRFAGISSSLLLNQVLTLLSQKKLLPLHLDATVIAQKPRIAPYKEQIRKNLCRLLALDSDAVNIKATTEEKLGFTGRLEGIKASCVVLCAQQAKNDEP